MWLSNQAYTNGHRVITFNTTFEKRSDNPIYSKQTAKLTYYNNAQGWPKLDLSLPNLLEINRDR